jgi:hypothetical protein
MKEMVPVLKKSMPKMTMDASSVKLRYRRKLPLLGACRLQEREREREQEPGLFAYQSKLSIFQANKKESWPSLPFRVSLGREKETVVEEWFLTFCSISSSNLSVFLSFVLR